MKASTWGWAIAAIVPMAAHAQSSVTLYGIIDVGLEYVNNTSANGHSLVREQSGNLYGSRWGLKGEEDLGGGLTAFFLLENGFNINDGTLGQSGRLFGRRAYVGLRKDGNEIQLGRMQTPIYDQGGIVAGIRGWTAFLLGDLTAELAPLVIVLCLIGLAHGARGLEEEPPARRRDRSRARPRAIVTAGNLEPLAPPPPPPAPRHPLDPDPDDPPLEPLWPRRSPPST